MPVFNRRFSMSPPVAGATGQPNAQPQQGVDQFLGLPQSVTTQQVMYAHPQNGAQTLQGAYAGGPPPVYQASLDPSGQQPLPSAVHDFLQGPQQRVPGAGVGPRLDLNGRPLGGPPQQGPQQGLGARNMMGAAGGTGGASGGMRARGGQPFGAMAFGAGFSGRGNAYSGFSNPAGRSRYDRRR
jgi:hypothetical protein